MADNDDNNARFSDSSEDDDDDNSNDDVGDTAPQSGAGGEQLDSSAAAASSGVAETDEADDGYIPPPPVPLAEILHRDEPDESLRRYREALLGKDAVVAAAADARAVTIVEMALLHDGGGPTYRLPLATDEDVGRAAATEMSVKEGQVYRIRVRFRVSKEVVLGLRFEAAIKNKLGITLERQRVMLGSYAPRVDDYEFTSPPGRYPEGMLARGSYRAACRFVDDDKSLHLAFEYPLRIAKHWHSPHARAAVGDV